MALFDAISIILLIVSCQFLFVAAPDSIDVRYATIDWKEAYAEVFESETELSVAQVYERITYLLEDLEIIKEVPSITEEMKDRVNYWNGVLTDTNHEHCTVEYLNSIRRQLESIRNPLTKNMQKLFILVQDNLVDICSKLQAHIIRNFSFRMGLTTKLDLVKIILFYESYNKGDITRKQLGERMFEMHHLDPKKSDLRYKIVNAWEHGPCGILRRALKEFQNGLPQWQSFREFTQLHNYGGHSPLELSETDATRWVRIGHDCNQLTMMMPAMVEENSV